MICMNSLPHQLRLWLFQLKVSAYRCRSSARLRSSKKSIFVSQWYYWTGRHVLMEKLYWLIRVFKMACNGKFWRFHALEYWSFFRISSKEEGFYTSTVIFYLMCICILFSIKNATEHEFLRTVRERAGRGTCRVEQGTQFKSCWPLSSQCIRVSDFLVALVYKAFGPYDLSMYDPRTWSSIISGLYGIPVWLLKYRFKTRLHCSLWLTFARC